MKHTFFLRLLALLLAALVLPCIPAASAEHFAMSAKDKGPCKALLGDAYIILVFVSTPQHGWTKEMKDKVNAVSQSSIEIMESEARRYGAKLNLRFGGLDYNIPYEHSTTGEWYDYIMNNIFHTPDIATLYDKYRTDLEQDTVAIIFLFNSWDRSYTYKTTRSDGSGKEYCVIFCDTEMHDNYLTHELLHLYGAIDYYDYDNEGVQRVAEKYFPNSDMLTVSHEVDELTAYLIGWTDGLGQKSQAFLQETEGLR